MFINWGYGISVNWREIKQGKCKFIYLTVLVNRPIRNEFTINFLFFNLYRFLRKEKIQILLEKIYGLASLRGKVAKIRNHRIKLLRNEAIIPFTYIGGIPCVEGKIAGVQIIGVVQDGKGAKVGTIYFNGNAIGRSVETDEFKGIYLSGISGLQGKNKSEKDPLFLQAKYIAKQCQSVFREQGVSASNIVQTWIYLPQILRCYKRFNKIRAKVFRECGLMSEDKVYLPASTGIQGEGRPKEKIFIDLIAFIPKRKRAGIVSMMKSKRQNEAREYGATFSRGIEIRFDRSYLLHISGTASINPEGKTIYVGDEQGQISETLINIGALLATKETDLRDIALTVAYCKNQITYKMFKELKEYLGLSSLPFIPIYADICRSDLLFEVDAIAIKQNNCPVTLF